MKLFHCSACANPVHFENFACVNCNAHLAYEPSSADIVSYGDVPPAGFNVCANADQAGCNWLVSDADQTGYCFACRLSSVVPDLSDLANLEHWRRLEAAKRYFLYGVLFLGLPVISRAQDPQHGLTFELLADWSADPGDSIMTGHYKGLITIDIAEANNPEREARRDALHEPMRTLVGHYRHESGHYYWNVLVERRNLTNQARAVFGDDGQDYQQALKTYYANGPIPNWQEQFISAYASCHPQEDFAESWAHYLHISDSLETAQCYGITNTPVSKDQLHGINSFDSMINAWVPLTVSVNALNRAMGQPDLYPFILSKPVVDKLRFIHNLIHQQ
ncbi:putative zinc-binding metallopeptidase [Rhizobium sp.]|jgi:hypothetical protein|uniref:zinc-binding metallopeptidase family protein n=1 Tax=Rhizobium sp. TaxID=391 RepID=UPI000E7E0382|nr:hypothetical protein [Rhizobium sp.]